MKNSRAKPAPGASSATSATKKRSSKRQPAATPTERIKRPALPRAEPLRGWSGIFGARNEPEQPRPAASPAKRANGSGRPTVQRGVELGYRVIDEYIKQGAAAASAFGGPRSAQLPSGEDLPKLTQRMMQYASDFSALWFDAMGVVINSMDQQNPQPVAGARRPLEEQARIVIDLHAASPVQVLATFDQPVPQRVVVEPGARAKGDSALAITLEPRTHPAAPLVLHVHVSKRVQRGKHTRALLDEASGNPVGRVTVTVAP